MRHEGILSRARHEKMNTSQADQKRIENQDYGLAKNVKGGHNCVYLNRTDYNMMCGVTVRVSSQCQAGWTRMCQAGWIKRQKKSLRSKWGLALEAHSPLVETVKPHID